MARVNLGKVVPEKGVDYMTPTEQQTFVRDITADVESELTPYINTKKGEISDTAATATTNFNDNATSKTSTFNSNASDKTTTFNENASDKTADFDSNATSKTNTFNTNATDKTTTFNNNAVSKTQDFNDNAAAKIAQLEYDLTPYSKIVDTGSKIILTINNTNFKMTASLKDKNDNVINTSNEIDLPLESVVVNGAYDSQTKKVVLTLQNGSTIEFSVADLVAGLQTEITSQHKLASDLVDDTFYNNKFVTASDKTNWNSKYNKPSSGIPESDLSGSIQIILSKADTAIQPTDYATSSTAGVIIASNNYNLNVNDSGMLCATTNTYQGYLQKGNGAVIGKGTLENVLNAVIGDINALLDTLNRMEV